MTKYHRSVLLREVIGYLRIKEGFQYLDCTLGDGGHSLEILKFGGNIIGLDVDPQALIRVEKRFEREGIDRKRFKLIKGNFRDLKKLSLQTDTRDQNFEGAIFDLGVSSLQLESPERGFSFAKMGPLDMRMDPSLQVKALDLINALSRKELYELFKTLGEEKYSWRLAVALERARKVKVIETTTELAGIVERTIGRKGDRIHPGTRVFQALRMAVNDELGALKESLEQVKGLIKNYGRICVISFHSLEDRIVKNTFKEWESKDLGAVLTKKPITPKEEEIEQNPRSRSAKLRVFERL